jgi:DNA-binding GntR family transcriptional regulator
MTGEDKNGTKDEDGNPQEKKRRNSVNLTELAYERIEHLIITCELKPGRFLSIQDLQRETGLSRTPVHQAVSRLAADTLVII